MPSVIYEDTLTGAGTAVMGGSRVLYVAWELTIEGPTVRRPVDGDTEFLNGVGYFALGNDLTPGGLISGIGLHDPHWFNWEVGQWLPIPALAGADLTYGFAQYIHWLVKPGSEVHVVVFGDT